MTTPHANDPEEYPDPEKFVPNWPRILLVVAVVIVVGVAVFVSLAPAHGLACVSRGGPARCQP